MKCHNCSKEMIDHWCDQCSLKVCWVCKEPIDTYGPGVHEECLSSSDKQKIKNLRDSIRGDKDFDKKIYNLITKIGERYEV